MKKILLVFLLLILFLSGCGETTEILNKSNESNPDITSNISEGYNVGKIEFMEIEYAGIDWNKIEFPIDSKEIEISVDIKSISTKESAIEIGKSIIEKCWSNSKFLNFVLIKVVHSTADNIWLFNYSLDQRDIDVDDLIDCGGFYVAIDGSNCEVVKAWVDE